MEAELEQAVALVKGASGGIGRATAVELARRGADVAVHYLRNEAGGGTPSPPSAGAGGPPRHSGPTSRGGRTCWPWWTPS